MKVLLLEDEESIRGFVRIQFKRNGFEVLEAETGEKALEIAKKEPDIAIAVLDVMLPGISGLEVCQELRKMYPQLGIIMLTAKAQEVNKIEGLNIGADDYITKPFSAAELIARMNSLKRRVETVPSTVKPGELITTGPFTLRLTDRKMIKNDQEIDCTPKEFAIIQLLMEQKDRAVSRDDILNEVWGKHYIGDLKVVDVNIRRIRQKIEDDPSKPKYLETVWGFGYQWKEGT
ncbi:response regulator transcription factor [Brevibacillus laterosporus]|uniref:response regulator transcription factor n=1 Tax=Brevibacillus laterosporus TaxID=1465 RepID=UPI000CE49AC4|nr:response regulator transcription factor [Brevibacillus laterosporus]MED1663228.1 response regulator transcription factor [Brevibacillus laterosporus]MED1671520.1 response regulator transcription factor [Brevibacillus laterosporus]MED1720160.1 response regulator transcription factor [Brevibacillus laterosporus]PPA81072.1 DNA-binding response regulator [Brevibacillus laterosporus]